MTSEIEIEYGGYRYLRDDNEGLASLCGETIRLVEGLKEGSDEVVIVTESGLALKFFHSQDCCEHVRLIDFDGSPDDIVGGLILSAEEINNDSSETGWGFETWTFYKIETSRGGIFMRWLGESNGYYSEAVEIRVGRVAGSGK